MSLVRIKICGIKTKEDAWIAVEEGADALGFVFATSSRQVNVEQAAYIIEELPPFVSKTGVFVNEELQKVLQIASTCGLDTLQLHGEEKKEYCRALHPWKVIKSFPALADLTVEECASYNTAAVLLDAVYQDLRGGGGRTFDWRRAVPFAFLSLILAGGLCPENVFEAVQLVRPFGVDVTSGVEENGSKNRGKIRRFIQEVRRWELGKKPPT